ncbi:MAG: hypothetical protein QGF71_00555, partial [Rhodospirillales bacterium]|nr:hypothetical protein [Rhodospirillales bacterium]
MHAAAAIETPNFAMWLTFALILGALAFYAVEKVAVEITSLGVLGAFMLFFHFLQFAQDHAALQPGQVI